MADAPVESGPFVARRSPGDRLGSYVYMVSRLHRMRRRFEGLSANSLNTPSHISMNYFYLPTGATLDDLREAVRTLEDADPIARRVLGSSNPVAIAIEFFLRKARAALGARDGGGDSRARSASRASGNSNTKHSVSGCAAPNTRRAILSSSSSIVTASRRSSSVALGS